MIEVGRLWRCLVLLEVTSMSSVLLSFCQSCSQMPKLGHQLYMTAWSDVAQIIYLGEKTFVIVSRQQMNGV